MSSLSHIYTMYIERSVVINISAVLETNKSLAHKLLINKISVKTNSSRR